MFNLYDVQGDTAEGVRPTVNVGHYKYTCQRKCSIWCDLAGITVEAFENWLSCS